MPFITGTALRRTRRTPMGLLLIQGNSSSLPGRRNTLVAQDGPGSAGDDKGHLGCDYSVPNRACRRRVPRRRGDPLFLSASCRLGYTLLSMNIDDYETITTDGVPVPKCCRHCG